jgi:hypothetical protein
MDDFGRPLSDGARAALRASPVLVPLAAIVGGIDVGISHAVHALLTALPASASAPLLGAAMLLGIYAVALAVAGRRGSEAWPGVFAVPIAFASLSVLTDGGQPKATMGEFVASLLQRCGPDVLLVAVAVVLADAALAGGPLFDAHRIRAVGRGVWTLAAPHGFVTIACALGFQLCAPGFVLAIGLAYVDVLAVIEPRRRLFRDAIGVALAHVPVTSVIVVLAILGNFAAWAGVVAITAGPSAAINAEFFDSWSVGPVTTALANTAANLVEAVSVVLLVAVWRSGSAPVASESAPVGTSASDVQENPFASGR